MANNQINENNENNGNNGNNENEVVNNEHEVVKIVGLTGSLRQKSFNKATLRVAQNIILKSGMFENVEMEIIDLADIPFFNEDVEAAGIPAVVLDLRQKLFAADGILIATPEYNFSIPPVLKNALDWASRGSELPLSGKPVAIMSASTGRLGGSRVQYHLRQVCVSLNMLAINKPELFISQAHLKFDEDGNLTDERTGRLIQRLLEELCGKLRKFKEG